MLHAAVDSRWSSFDAPEAGSTAPAPGHRHRVWSLMLAAPAFAQYVAPRPTRVGSATDNQTLIGLVLVDRNPVGGSRLQVDPARTGRAEVTAGSRRQGLPATGGDVVGLTAFGVGAIVSGGLILHVRRHAARA